MTDHGWLYVPGGLPEVELPYYLTKDERMKKGRTGTPRRRGESAGKKRCLGSGIQTCQWQSHQGLRASSPAPSMSTVASVRRSASPPSSLSRRRPHPVAQLPFQWNGEGCARMCPRRARPRGRSSTYDARRVTRAHPCSPAPSSSRRTGVARILVVDDDAKWDASLPGIGRRGGTSHSPGHGNHRRRELTELDALDRLAADAFPGSVVRKDLALKFKGQYPVPTYVGEFLLGRYCASTDEGEIAEGLAIVQRQLQDRTVRAGEQELFKSRAREHGTVKLIDLVTARLDTATDSYVATLPSLHSKMFASAMLWYASNERMLTGGFYAEIDLEYDAAITEEASGRPFGIVGLRPIQLSRRDMLDVVRKGRAASRPRNGGHLLLRSVGLRARGSVTSARRIVLLLRMVPFVERNYNMVELGPRAPGKSHLFQQISPDSHLVSGGKATVAKMFVDNCTGRRGLVCPVRRRLLR